MVLATANTGKKKLGRGFEKNAGVWTERVEISKEEIPCSRSSMHGYARASFKGRTSELWLNRRVFYFCIRSTPLRGQFTRYSPIESSRHITICLKRTLGNKAEWAAKSEIRKAEFLAVSEARKAIFWLTPALKKENLWWLWILSRRDLNFCALGTQP